jgi:AAA+ superfamily predicted ATPase
MVFDAGCWHKNRALYKAIQQATLDNLILAADLKESLRVDVVRFYASKETYAGYRIPWKRGILLVGPPGNGKTHLIKALINSLDVPCLYVKSFKNPCGTDHDAIRSVFARVRQTVPCILVLEDLDSLIDDGNRSFFLAAAGRGHSRRYARNRHGRRVAPRPSGTWRTAARRILPRGGMRFEE